MANRHNGTCTDSGTSFNRQNRFSVHLDLFRYIHLLDVPMVVHPLPGRTFFGTWTTWGVRAPAKARILGPWGIIFVVWELAQTGPHTLTNLKLLGNCCMPEASQSVICLNRLLRASQHQAVPQVGSSGLILSLLALCSNSVPCMCSLLFHAFSN